MFDVVSLTLRVQIKYEEIDHDPRSHPILSVFPSFSLPYVLCDPTDLIWRKWIPFEAMTSRTAPSSDGLLAEVFEVFFSRKTNSRRSVHNPQDHFIITLIISDGRD